ncbi:hypothetical protein P8605_20580 [Streptomyces sp. T-3]|nr:hypothetical protein [Streptomyces sp. T-3]
MRLQLFDIRCDDPAYEEFLDGQARAYARLGHQAMVTFGKDNPETTLDPMWGLAAFDEDGCLLGGLRVHRKIDGRLPSEVHLRSPEVERLVAKARTEGASVAEVCGLWVDSTWRGCRSDLAQLLTVAGIAAAQTVGATIVAGSCAAARVPALERCGFRFRRDLPLVDVPFPGITSYFALDQALELQRREERLSAAAQLVRHALEEGRVPAAAVSTMADLLGLRPLEAVPVS